jgi:hypothetical protein
MSVAALPSTRDGREELAWSLVLGVITQDESVPWTYTNGELRLAIDVTTFERGITLARSAADVVMSAGFPSVTTFNPIPIGDCAYRVVISVSLGADL